MKCPQCNNAMVRRSKYVWNEHSERMVVVYYWRCGNCGTIVND